MLADFTRDDTIAEVERPDHFNDDTEPPSSIRIRIFRLVIGDGDEELLVTSLLDQKRYPLKDLKKLYYK